MNPYRDICIELVRDYLHGYIHADRQQSLVSKAFELLVKDGEQSIPDKGLNIPVKLDRIPANGNGVQPRTVVYHDPIPQPLHKPVEPEPVPMLAGEPQGTPEPRPVIPEPSKPTVKAEPKAETKAKPTKRGHRWTDEQRFKASQRAIERNARKRAEREAQAQPKASSEEGDDFDQPATARAGWCPPEVEPEPNHAEVVEQFVERVEDTKAARLGDASIAIGEAVRSGKAITNLLVGEWMADYGLNRTEVNQLLQEARDAAALARLRDARKVVAQ